VMMCSPDSPPEQPPSTFAQHPSMSSIVRGASLNRMESSVQTAAVNQLGSFCSNASHIGSGYTGFRVLLNLPYPGE
jgi:hypothetical protein